jgi:hypothetical protein
LRQGRRAGHPIKVAALVAAAISEAVSGKPVELGWQDEARVGHQGTLIRIWPGFCAVFAKDWL